MVFFGFSGLWRGDFVDLEIEAVFDVGEWVRLKDGVGNWKFIISGSIGVV